MRSVIVEAQLSVLMRSQRSRTAVFLVRVPDDHRPPRGESEAI